jgi:formate hydrogenlyase transcriptional activator
MNKKNSSSDERATFYILIHAITARLVSSRGEEIDEAVDDCLSWMGRYFGVENVSLGGITKSGELASTLRVWGKIPPKDKTLAINPSPGPDMVAQFVRDGSFVYNQLEDLDKFPQYREHSKKMGVEAAAFWAHRDLESHVEGIAISSPNPKAWPDDIVERLGAIGVVLFNAIYRRQAELEAKQLRKFDRIVSEIASNFVHLPLEQVDGEIEKALGEICECVNADWSTTLFWNGQEKTTFTVSHEWHAKSIDNPYWKGTIISEKSWMTERLKEAKVIRITKPDDFPPEAASVREICGQLGLWSMLWVPFSTSRGLHGYVTLGTVNRPGSWSEDVISQLSLMGNVFAKAIEHRRAALEAKQLRQFQQVVSKTASRFIHLPPEQVDGEINRALSEICCCVDADWSTTLFWNNQEKTEFTVSHEWQADSIDSPCYKGSVISIESWLMTRLQKAKVFYISKPDDFPPEAVKVREAYGQLGIWSMLCVPFSTSLGLHGYVTLNTVNRPGSWSEDVISQLSLIGNIFANAIEHQKADLKLQNAYNEIRELKDHIEADNITLRNEIKASDLEDDLIGKSHAFRTALHQVEQVGPTYSTVLILGETGTGKGMIARRIHELSGRKDRPMVVVNCAALPAALIESELFGHEKGAFTGADKRKIGRFELADGGTILLDEVGDLPLELQAKLLRILHDHEFERLGSSTTRTVDTRVMAATNRDLDKLISQGVFRADLYYRLGVFPIRIPSLRERSDDIPLLVWYFITNLQARLGKKIDKVPAPVMDALISYDWPGNVRELRNVIERAMILTMGIKLELKSVLPTIQDGMEASLITSKSPSAKLEEVDRAHITSVLEDCGWKIRGEDGAADRLGLKRSTLQSRMKKLGIQRPTK